MSNVIQIASYITQREASNATPLPSTDDRSSGSPGRSETINANTLQRLDPDAELSKFLALASMAIDQMRECGKAFSSSDPLSADDMFMASKITLSQLLMYRNLSDAIGIVVFKCFQAASAMKAITDIPQLPEILERALEKLSRAPFMKFEDACDVVNTIEEAAGPLCTPGYRELANELIGDAGV